MALRYTLRWIRGDDLYLEVECLDESGTLIELDGFTAVWTISGTDFPMTVTDEPGVLALHLTSAQTAALRESDHNLRLYAPDGDVQTVLIGSARRAER
jgi:hypothetical protein